MPVYRDLNPYLECVQEVASLVGNYVELTVDLDVDKADFEESPEDFWACREWILLFNVERLDRARLVGYSN
ncbi:hypothetical protein BT96DRAFT_521757 [Gymnopus androsaceus JB14]|uniref:Uncharacterized protein n=1 Tax=Gymnopus androsaceus JB14 TaxID=1447944 RepID=A0A6A4HYI5_9AGAR|nr:hypothetical protein BT96DRAFT_521757 [Gymnopus androsaceus JB14]